MATFNWIITCDCGNPSEHHCSTCGKNLCNTCKQTHLQNNDTRRHSVVEYTEKLTPGNLLSLLCHNHDENECVYWCQICDKAACIDCVTDSHRGHEFTKLNTIFRERRASLQKELDNLENKTLKGWKELMAEATNKTSEFLDRVNVMDQKIEERANEFHKKVDEIKETNKKELNEFKTLKLAVLHEQEKKVLEGLEKVKQKIKECEDRLRSSDMENLLEHEVTKDDKKNLLPAIFCVKVPVFSHSQIDTKSLTEMFGQLTAPKPNQVAEGDIQTRLGIGTSNSTQKFSTTGMDKASNATDTMQSTATGQTRPIQATSRDTREYSSTTAVPIKRPTRLIPKPSVLLTFGSGIRFPIVACVGSGKAWVQTESNKLQLVNSNGSVKATLQIDFNIGDMVPTLKGEILLTDSTNSCIKLISRERMVRTLCNLQSEPSGLCCLHSGNIAVTFGVKGRVIIHSISGEVIKELEKKMFKEPYRVAQNKVNSDLYITDGAAGKVLALDKDFKVRYEYTGSDNRKSFCPRGLCTDYTGHVLIADYDNDRVDILDQDGLFLQYLVTAEQGLSGPYSIDVDEEGNACVGESGWFRGCVKVMKYLQ